MLLNRWGMHNYNHIAVIINLMITFVQVAFLCIYKEYSWKKVTALLGLVAICNITAAREDIISSTQNGLLHPVLSSWYSPKGMTPVSSGNWSIIKIQKLHWGSGWCVLLTADMRHEDIKETDFHIPCLSYKTADRDWDQITYKFSQQQRSRSYLLYYIISYCHFLLSAFMGATSHVQKSSCIRIGVRKTIGYIWTKVLLWILL